MQYDLSINEDDFLTYSLYKASKNKRTKQQMNGSWAWLSVAFFFIGIVCYFTDNVLLATWFGILGLAILVFYPAYQKRRYVNQYKAYIKDQYTKDIAIRKIELLSDHIQIENSYSEIALKFAGLSHIGEISTHIFINLKGGNGIIIPKTTNGFDTLKVELQDISNKHGLAYITELNWKW